MRAARWHIAERVKSNLQPFFHVRGALWPTSLMRVSSLLLLRM